MQEPRIGVGVCTRNRPKYLKPLVLNLLQCRGEGPLWYDIFVADDGSEDEAQKLLLELAMSQSKRPYSCIATNFGTPDSARVGIAKNKNRILRYFRDYDFIIIIEDDLYIRDCSRWIAEHIRAHKVSHYHHFGHVLPNVMGQRALVSEYTENVHVNFTEHCTGMFLFFTKTVLETVGGFDERFGLYGWEHMEYSERIVKAGLCGTQNFRKTPGLEKACYPSLLNINELVGSDLPESVMTVAECAEQMKVNQLIWDKSREEGGLFRPF